MPQDQNEQGPVIRERIERDHPAKATKKKTAQSNNHEVSREALVGELKKDLEAGKPLTKTPAQPPKKKRKRRTKAEMEAARAAQATQVAQATPQPPAPQTEAPKKKKRKRRTKAEMEAARATQAAATTTPPPAPQAESEPPAPPKKRRRRKQWRKGRVWPTYKFSMYMVIDSKIVYSREEQLTKKPAALQAALDKFMKKFTVDASAKE